MRYRVLAATLALTAFLALGTTAASAADTDSADQPALAQTGADFTPMLITAAVLLLVAGITVVVAKYTIAKHSSR